MQIDATRQRIPSGESQAWRAAWRLATSEVLFGLAVACTGVGVVAMMGLLQMPTLGTDDPVAFSRWATAARQQQGELFDLLTTLGLNNVMHAVWWQVAALLSLLIATLRFADVLAWARYAQHNAAILDEERASVIHTTPSLQRLAAWLQDQALRTREVGENTLAALSGWRSHVAAGLLYGGVMLTSAALLVDARLGWLAGEQLLVAEVPISLPDQRTLMLSQAGDDAYQFRIEPSGSTVALREGQSGALDGVSLHTKRVVEGYRASA
ncbi:MAG: hypothetical protein N2545_01290, partial [Thermoflexales bacterium]|nr:hypothetical protein [Thermoflexales bacterium]